MDSESLRTASTYLNNLLLARGHLRNSEPIDFVKPSRESRAQIINLVHDLILRGDRDKDQREALSITLKQVRADDARKNADLDRLREKTEANARSAVQAQAAERAAKEELKKAEKSLKVLQEQSVKIKTTLAQVKTQCANDVRKRDLELARLKTHLQGQQRGNKAAVAAPSITITGGVRGRQGAGASGRDVRDPEYSLKQETTEFLTQLSQSLSDENDGLISLLRDALATLKELLGLPVRAHQIPDSAVGSRGSSDEATDEDNMLHALPTSYESLASELEIALSHLKRILTNPNFVSMDEVEARDDEIIRLRQGWEHMEKRWRDVLMMMDGWRRRMDTGDTINLDDLRQGMGLCSPEREARPVTTGPRSNSIDESFANSETSDAPAPAPAGKDDDLFDESSIMDIQPPHLSDSLTAIRASKRKRDVLEPPTSFDLRPPGAALKSPARQMQVPVMQQPYFSDDELGAEENIPDLEEEEDLSDHPHMTVHEKLNAAAQEAADAQAARDARSRASPSTSTSKSKLTTTKSPSKSISKSISKSNPASRSIPIPASEPWSRAKACTLLEGANDASPSNLPRPSPQKQQESEDEMNGDTLGKIFSPVKRTKIRGRAKRRKSTLSREELEELLLLDAGDGE